MNTFWENLGETEENVDERLWELYNENSKLIQYQKQIPYDVLQAKTQDLIISQNFFEYPTYKLPDALAPVKKSFWEIVKERRTARNIQPDDISLEEVASILFSGYGVTQDNKDTEFPHPFRTIPSAGGLYPLEIYFHHNYIDQLTSGLFHYNPLEHTISQLQTGDQTRKISKILIQPEVAINASVIVFITAMFKRSTFKYGERGYRFSLMEAGHMAQNMSLTAHGLGWASVNIGGFIDANADAFLNLDGVNNTCLYALAIGRNNE